MSLRTVRVAEPTAADRPRHMDVNALDLTGVADPALAFSLEQAAAENLRRIVRPAPVDWTSPASSA